MTDEILPGIYTDMPNEVYHSHYASYSKSSLAKLDEYPYLLQWDRMHHERKTIFDLGAAAHTAILEPDKYEDTVAIVPEDVLGKNGAKSTNAYKEWVKSQPKEKAILTIAQRDQVLAMRDSIHENPNHSEARDYLTGGLPEVSFFWWEYFRGESTDPCTGYKRMAIDPYSDPEANDDPDNYHRLLMKCRPDYIPSKRIYVDLKTTGLSIDQETFKRHAYNLKYHWSAALTNRGAAVAMNDTRRQSYVFVVIKTDPPHEVAAYKATQEFIACGMLEVLRAMQKLAWCDKYNIWPGMPNKTQQLGLPPYIHRKLIKERLQ